MIKISPSLLAADFADLKNEIRKIEYSADMLHIDVMDGHFVPNLSIGVPVVKSIRRVTDLVLDVHLMIENPLAYIKTFALAGADIITVHIEAPDNIGECIHLIKKLGLKAGLALNPDTNPDLLKKYVDDIDMVLQMTVFPGFGGQSIEKRGLDNISRVREIIGPDMDLEVDGGIYENNSAAVVKAGANVLVAGTGIFGQENAAWAVNELRNAATKSYLY